ncbi:hypothetical protein LRS10_05805 [Phenylobacterium sp. J426]|uniref:hypothetical protein n=1 Tax=Phenylobacterium sp. J426 TaxID=2898439 RepID=UPI0021515AF8|nr:hypothetical protein [Phenylobacterium sp. J426]MCR5873733.1 hypothetical protein [Phenylobacterium sp. J426]
MRHRLAFAVLALQACAGAAWAMTPAQISAGFQEGAIAYCLQAALRGVAVGDLPAEARQGIAPADETMRGMVEASNPKGPLWDVASAKGIVVVSEPKPGVCKVMAYGAPVERTFKGVLNAARKTLPAFKPVPIQPGYDPIVYRLERNEPAPAIALELRGAEPGAPGRLFRFSMLTARITYTPGEAGGQ